MSEQATVEYDKQATEELKALVSTFSEQVRRAEGRFESDGRSLEFKASITTISSAAELADIMSESERITRELYIAYETAVAAIDEACEPYAKKNVGPEPLCDLAKLLDHINSECSTLGSNYSASLNDNDFGNIVSTRFRPSASSLATAARWRARCDMHPAVVAERELEEQRKAERAKAEAERIAKEAAEFDEKLPELMRQYEEECARIDARRENAYAERYKKESEKLTSRILGSAQRDFDEVSEKVGALQQEIAELESQRSALGLLKVGEKLKLTAAIDEKRRKLESAQKDLDWKKTVLESSQERLRNRLSDLEHEVRKDVEWLLPYPSKPRKPRVPGAPVTDINDQKDAIEEYLISAGPSTITDIMEGCPEAASLSAQRVSALLRQLRDEGRVTREEIKRKAYFYV
ncbi:MAG: hypothetical protein Q4D06_01545 [Coriobacteriia bacterium]|nr:hypothetical protein [Coriobacteriia bacterium]